MMFNLYKNGEYVNGIEATLEIVKKYCEEKGYTYVEIPVVKREKETLKPDEIISEYKIQAVSDRLDFVEDCIAEMAMQVYSE